MESDKLKMKHVGTIRDQTDAVIRCISFHPKLLMFLTAAYDKMIRIYEIREKGIEVSGLLHYLSSW